MKKRCAACGSERIIPMASLGNREDPGGPTVVIHQNPRSLLGQRTVYGPIHAWVCGECGYMPLFADNPQELYSAYEQFLRATRE